MIIYLITIFSFFTSFFFLKFLIPLLSNNFLDNPTERSSHKFPVPTGGGISFVLVGIVSSLFLNFWTPLISAPLAFVGFMDDKKSISALIRYLIQFITVLVISLNSNLVDKIGIMEINSLQKIVFIIFLLILGTAIINFINFMDGLDGIVTINSVLIFFVAVFLGNFHFLPIISSLIGFLILNWSPAKVFMGDVGSTFIGAIYFGVIINSQNFQDSIFLLIVGIPLLGDAFICVVRRFISGQNIFSPHKSHLYQRLNQSGISHDKVSLIYSTLTFITFLNIFKFGLNLLPFYFIFITLTYLYMDRYIAVPFRQENN